MSEEKAKLNGPDFTQEIELSTVPDGTMLLGQARGGPMLRMSSQLGDIRTVQGSASIAHRA